jgi:hypothetical protein
MAAHDSFSRELPSLVASSGSTPRSAASPSSSRQLPGIDVARAWAQFIETLDQPEAIEG